MKGSDFSCVPLCREHHRELHDRAAGSFYRKYHVGIFMEGFKVLVEWCDRGRR